MLPNTDERYLTTPLFAEIPEDMDADEVALSQSTPDFRWAEAATGGIDRKQDLTAPVTSIAAKTLGSGGWVKALALALQQLEAAIGHPGGVS